jgi:hypothetical protein
MTEHLTIELSSRDMTDTGALCVPTVAPQGHAHMAYQLTDKETIM